MKPQDAQLCYPKSESEGIYKPTPKQQQLSPPPPPAPTASHCAIRCTPHSTHRSRLFRRHCSRSSLSHYPSREAPAIPDSPTAFLASFSASTSHATHAHEQSPGKGRWQLGNLCMTQATAARGRTLAFTPWQLGAPAFPDPTEGTEALQAGSEHLKP